MASRPNYSTVPALRRASDPLGVPSDDDAFATLMRFLDQPTPSCTGANCSASVNNGKGLFTHVVMCVLCHNPAMTTGPSAFTVNPPGLSGVQGNLYSDLLLHRMGLRLSEGISQGSTQGDKFREQHASLGSEANGVIARFKALTEQQDVLDS